jgi:hypothetical protein
MRRKPRGDVPPKTVTRAVEPVWFGRFYDRDWSRCLADRAYPLEPGVAHKIIGAGKRLGGGGGAAP